MVRRARTPEEFDAALQADLDVQVQRHAQQVEADEFHQRVMETRQAAANGAKFAFTPLSAMGDTFSVNDEANRQAAQER